VVQEVYFNFRRYNVPEGAIVALMVFDLSAPRQVYEGSPLDLRTTAGVVGTTRPFEDATYPQFLLEVPVRPAAYIEATYQPVDDATGSVQVYDCVKSTGERLSEAAVFGVPTRVGLPVPEESNIVRVAGQMLPDAFLVSGASWYAALSALLRLELGSMSASAHILDWGVGCGRIARYFLEDGFEELHGVDIDAVNVAWCIENFPGATFQRCGFDPPLPYTSSSFDVVYGHSVFSHLDEPSEKSWLRELNRVLAPGGVGCVTISSEFAARLDFSHLLNGDPAILPTLVARGRYDLGPQAVGVDEGREGYYRMTLHTRDRVEREWTKYVDVARIIAGFADSQDAVVFRKKR
jgi:SAM-dependent methyltransferase